MRMFTSAFRSWLKSVACLGSLSLYVYIKRNWHGEAVERRETHRHFLSFFFAIVLSPLGRKYFTSAENFFILPSQVQSPDGRSPRKCRVNRNKKHGVRIIRLLDPTIFDFIFFFIVNNLLHQRIAGQDT